MATSSSSLASRAPLGRALRERYLADVSQAMVEIGEAVQTRWTELVSEVCVAREAQLRRDAWTAYRAAHSVWVERTLKEWRACLDPVQEKQAAEPQDFAGLELVGTDVMENKILASRMVLAVNDKVVALAGFGLTPLPLAPAPIATQSKTPMVVMAAATSMITEASPYIIRTSFTLPQVSIGIAEWAQHRL